jgi:hypothetical protein
MILAFAASRGLLPRLPLAMASCAIWGASSFYFFLATPHSGRNGIFTSLMSLRTASAARLAVSIADSPAQERATKFRPRNSCWAASTRKAEGWGRRDPSRMTRCLPPPILYISGWPSRLSSKYRREAPGGGLPGPGCLPEGYCPNSRWGRSAG